MFVWCSVVHMVNLVSVFYTFNMTRPLTSQEKKRKGIRRKLNGLPAKANSGRPTVITPEILLKIEEVAALDGTVEEMLFFADISKGAYYDYMAVHPEFKARIERLRETSILAARRVVIEKSKESYYTATDYLARKRKREFSLHADLEVTHTVPKPILDMLSSGEVKKIETLEQ